VNLFFEIKTKTPVYLLWSLALSVTACTQKPAADYSGWATYAGSKEGIRYSSNTQINRNNVIKLKQVWTYSTGDRDTANKSQIQCNPIVINGTLYGTSPMLKLFALDAASGRQKWVFDPANQGQGSKKAPTGSFKITRGVTYWQDNDGRDKRILYGVGSRIYAVNANNGEPVKTFGRNGYIDLAAQLDRDSSTFNSFVANTTPGIVYGNLYIVGTRVGEGADAAPGAIRAYNIVTGERKWIFHTIPQPGEKYYDTWPDRDAWKKLGGANSWAGMALDEKEGVVYVPTGSIGGDFYGGYRKGQNLYGNSLIALDAATGKYIWHYQVVHHDLWDRDLPANPNLITIKHDGKTIQAVAQITKHGYIFLFDRMTGKPVFPIQERPVPSSDLPGEEAWPTQPIPTLPEPFARNSFTAVDVTDRTPQVHQEMMDRFNKVKYHKMFTPPSKEGAWIFPGFDGGGEWGGAAVDPESGILYINSSELPWSLTMIDAVKGADNSLRGIGQTVYGRYCVSCHGPDRKGNGQSIPSLLGLEKKYDPIQAWKIISGGRNMMPAFKQISESEKNAILAFLLNLEDKEPGGRKNGNAKKATAAGLAKHSILDEVKYEMTGYNRFTDKDGYPGIKPPWGTLNAVNLNSGKLLWKVPLGEYEELKKRGIPPTGTEGYGGPVVTRGGIVFIAASRDAKIRGFDSASGKMLWEALLPVPGYATPAVYLSHGKEYLVIACGGGKIGSRSGDQYVAFALPDGNLKR
jgi:quinoprotein glucose dehydrogenase